MRFASLAPSLLAALILALAPAVGAQDDGCLQANPCLLDVEVDTAGIASISVTTFSSGDWYYLSVSNLDSADHTVSIEGHDAGLHVPGDLYADTAPFRIGAPGTYDLRDQPSGDTAPLTVVAGDSLGGNGTGSGAGNGAPGMGAGLIVVGLAALAVLRRRMA